MTPGAPLEPGIATNPAVRVRVGGDWEPLPIESVHEAQYRRQTEDLRTGPSVCSLLASWLHNHRHRHPRARRIPPSVIYRVARRLGVARATVERCARWVEAHNPAAKGRKQRSGIQGRRGRQSGASRRGRKQTFKRDRRIRHLRQTGATVRQVAERVGCSASTVATAPDRLTRTESPEDKALRDAAKLRKAESRKVWARFHRGQVQHRPDLPKPPRPQWFAGRDRRTISFTSNQKVQKAGMRETQPEGVRSAHKRLSHANACGNPRQAEMRREAATRNRTPATPTEPHGIREPVTLEAADRARPAGLALLRETMARIRAKQSR